MTSLPKLAISTILAATGAGLWLGLASCLLAVLGSGFLLAGLYMWLKALYTAVIAAGILGGGVLLCSLLCALAGAARRRRRHQQIARLSHELELFIPEIIRMAERDMEGFVSEQPITALSLAAAMGFAMGGAPR